MCRLNILPPILVHIPIDVMNTIDFFSVNVEARVMDLFDFLFIRLKIILSNLELLAHLYL